MKKISLILSLVLLVSLFAGCAGTPVIYYSDCTCPVGSHDVQPTQPAPAETIAPQEPVGEGAVKVTYRFTDIYNQQYWTEAFEE